MRVRHLRIRLRGFDERGGGRWPVALRLEYHAELILSLSEAGVGRYGRLSGGKRAVLIAIGQCDRGLPDGFPGSVGVEASEGFLGCVGLIEFQVRQALQILRRGRAVRRVLLHDGLIFPGLEQLTRVLLGHRPPC